MTTSRILVIPTRRAHSNHAEVARSIGVDIIAGRYAEGTRLPGDAEMIAMFGVSRPVLRESIEIARSLDYREVLAYCLETSGELAFGTVDTWLLWQLTGGRVHATEPSNASRTLCFDIRRLDRRQNLASARVERRDERRVWDVVAESLEPELACLELDIGRAEQAA